MAKNLLAKTRPDNQPYEVWTTNPMLWEQLSNIADLKARAGAMTDHGAWTWLVLKKWQADDNKPNARWFCRVMTPIVPQGELGDVYVDEIRGVSMRVFADNGKGKAKSSKRPRNKSNTYPSMVDDIIQYESGNMTQEQMVNFFQKLIDTGIVWELQGSYGRTATQLLKAGLIYDSHFDETVGE